jgi:hypothetical protein|tara:strand:+ start:80 stop:256 length:177 start_codon:yes stop_codon:yes gene_type:complete
MKTSDKVRNMIDNHIREDISAAFDNRIRTGPDYSELLDILVEVSKLEAINETLPALEL